RVTAGSSGGAGERVVGLDGLGPGVVGDVVADGVRRVAGDVSGLLDVSLHAVSTAAAPATTTPRRVTRSMAPVLLGGAPRKPRVRGDSARSWPLHTPRSRRTGQHGRLIPPRDAGCRGGRGCVEPS